MSPNSERNINGLDRQADTQYERLQESLEEYGEEDLVEVNNLEEADNLGDIPKEEKYRLTDEDTNELLSFYITTAADIESESALIINAAVFDFGMMREGSLQFLNENFTQRDREDMLYYLGLIDDGLKGELARVRRRRNELAHTNQHNDIEDIDRVQNSIKRAKEAKDKLRSIGDEVEKKKTGFYEE